jgi:mannose-1-phosphate guanylyltransferase
MRASAGIRPLVTFVVMAGGKGERLWPLVRADHPKACLSLDGRRTLLQAAIERLAPAWPDADWLIVTTREQEAAIRRSLAPRWRRALVVEPRANNTATCIALAAAALVSRQPRRVMVAAPADHWVGNGAAFRAAVRVAIQAAAATNRLVTIGIPATAARLGLGYLCAGAAWRDRRLHRYPSGRGRERGRPRIFRLVRMIEKPPRGLAERLIRRPRTYWNSGVFVGTAETFVACVTEHLPEHLRRMRLLMRRRRDAGRGRGGWARALRSPQALAAYRTLEPVSFDHGVMRHLRDGLVVEGRFPWTDVGSWDVWVRLGRSAARTLAVNSRNVTVVGPNGHLVAAIGVRDLVVVHTPTATLICRQDRAQAVREVARRLAQDPRMSRHR